MDKASGVREPASIRAWLMQVARRLCIDFHRRRRPTEPLSIEPSSPLSHNEGRLQRLHAAIQQLPQTYREAIVLYYLDGRNCCERRRFARNRRAGGPPATRPRPAMLHDLLQEDRV